MRLLFRFCRRGIRRALFVSLFLLFPLGFLTQVVVCVLTGVTRYVGGEDRG